MRIVDRLSNRARLLFTEATLKGKYFVYKGDVVADYGCMKLGFSNDGDMQEVLYHTYCRDWHDSENDVLREHVTAGQSVIDVGANMGFVSVILSRLVGANGRLLCFEPSKEIFGKLRRTVALNGLANVELYNQGCGTGSSKAALFKISESSGNSSLVNPGNLPSDGQGVEAIDLVSLDELLLPREQRIDFIKIDVEGYEPSVLKGALQIIRRYRPGIYIELCAEYADSSAEAIRILSDNGYIFTREPDLKNGNGTNFIAKHRDRFGESQSNEIRQSKSV